MFVVFAPSTSDGLGGGMGDDIVRGGPGADALRGGGGDDTLLGQGGDDYAVDGDVEATSTVDGDVMDGGSGRDRVDYASRTAAIGVDLSSSDGDGGNSGAPGENDDVDRFEDVYSGSGDDTLTGAASDNGHWRVLVTTCLAAAVGPTCSSATAPHRAPSRAARTRSLAATATTR